jgi:hypothetical protein
LCILLDYICNIASLIRGPYNIKLNQRYAPHIHEISYWKHLTINYETHDTTDVRQIKQRLYNAMYHYTSIHHTIYLQFRREDS